MNRFRNLGFIEYNGGIYVHKSLLNVILLDKLPEPTSAAASVSPVSKARKPYLAGPQSVASQRD